MFRSSKFLLIVLIVLVFSTAAFAFAASNTMPGSTYAGEGSSGTLGYIVSAPKYTLNTGTPSNIDQVGFTLNVPASSVKVRLDSSVTGIYYNCTSDAAKTTWTCDTTALTQLTVGKADEFRVIAVQ